MNANSYEIMSDSNDQLRFAALGFYLLCLFLPIPKLLGFLAIPAEQEFTLLLWQVMELLVLILGFTSFAVIILTVRMESPRMKNPYRLRLLGYMLGFVAVSIQAIAMIMGQIVAVSQLIVPSAVYWTYWPFFSFISMLLSSLISGASLAVSYQSSRIRKMRILDFDFALPIRVASLGLFAVLGVLLPYIGTYGYLVGNYLFGRVSLRSVAVEVFRLFDRSMAYGLPNESYFGIRAISSPIYTILGMTAGIYLVLSSFAIAIILIGLSLEHLNKLGRTMTHRLMLIGRTLGVSSLSILWSAYLLVYLAQVWPQTYDVFFDFLGIGSGIVALACVYVATQSTEKRLALQSRDNFLRGVMGRRFKRSASLWAIPMLFLVLSTAIAIEGVGAPFSTYHPTISVQDNLQSCLEVYEQSYVRSMEDSSYGFVPGDGYPMYVFILGEMYYWLYLKTQQEEYGECLLRLTGTTHSIRNDDWTWNMGWRGGISNLYNSQAAALFLYSYKILQNELFLEYARSSLNALTRDGVVQLSGTNNDKFLAFTTIAGYLAETDSDDDIRQLGVELFNFSISQYDLNTSRWYYSDSDMIDGKYNAHDAYYQIINIYNFLKQRTAIEKIYPSIAVRVDTYMSDMLNVAIAYMNENGTFYYKPETDDYTESAADVLVTLELFDSVFGTNHSSLKLISANTILNRQLSNGAFMRTGQLHDGYTLWYTDNIGKSLAHWLYLIT